MNDFKLSIPLLWPPQLQAMLPKPALTLVHEQNARIQGQWKVVTERFPSLTYDEYLWSWLIMNTRTFYHSTPETETYEWLERVALLPVADLLNHAERGCRVLYSDTEYSITTDRVYNTGEEICNSYGEHTNDFLLGEYGFILTQNCWDEICIDDAILSQLTEIQRSNLETEGLAKDLRIGANKEPCDRTMRAMQMLCSQSANGLDQLEPSKEAKALLASCLRRYLNTIDKTVDSIKKMKDVEQAQQDLLLQRWRQIRTTVSDTIHQLTNTTEM
ncbi:hypothetical protein E8E14_002972 [Neopestalotiopsis sp. 37M]|nr:hypothetical protein E8E14_002972 [Neopestalotiopsis sp. 37M]